MDPSIRAALIEAWVLHRRRLYVLCRRWVGTPADAEDIVSDVIVKALEDEAGAATVVSYLAWLTRIARNLCMDQHRELGFRRRALEHVIRRLPCEGQEVKGPEALRLQEELGEHLARAMGELPPLLFEPCERRFLQDMPYEQIAAELGISNAAVRKRIQEARALLQARMSAYQRDGVMVSRRRPRRRKG